MMTGDRRQETGSSDGLIRTMTNIRCDFLHLEYGKPPIDATHHPWNFAIIRLAISNYNAISDLEK